MLRYTHPQATFLTAALLIVLSPSRLEAHVDPSGDVHPSVRVENGRFVIDFYNNLDNELDAHVENRFRMIFGKDGSLVAPRHRTRVLDQRDWLRPFNSLPKTRVGEETITYDLHTSHPTLLVSRDDGSRRRVSLPWPDDYEGNTFFDHATATANHVVLLGSRWVDGDDRTAPPQTELFLYVFKRNSSNPPNVHRLGRVADINLSPRCSHVIAANGRFWVAWMHINVDADKIELILSSAGKGENDIHSRILEAPGHWNTLPSIAAIGDRLCVAYHYGNAYQRPLTTSRIVTVFEDAVVKAGKK